MQKLVPVTFLAVLAFAFTESHASPSPFGQSGTGYVLTFQEEFDNDGLNGQKWNDYIWYEAGLSHPVNYEVSSGTLKIWPKKDSGGNFFNRTIDTDGKFSQAYGFFEIEAKLPIGKGVWPGFWLLNHSTERRPEIDIFEAFPGAGPDSGWSTADWHPIAYAATVWRDGSTGDMASSVMVKTTDLSAGFNKYGMKWERNKITFYFNGKQVASTSVRMKDRMYILISLWFGSISGQPDDTTPQENNSFEVNYVRVWKQK